MTDDHEARSNLVYSIGNEPVDIPDGLLVISSHECGLCNQSLRNTNYLTLMADGTPITWLDTKMPDSLNKFYATPGIGYDHDKNLALVNGEPMSGMPCVVFVRNNTVIGSPLKFGEIQDGEFEILLKKTREMKP